MGALRLKTSSEFGRITIAGDARIEVRHVAIPDIGMNLMRATDIRVHRNYDRGRFFIHAAVKQKAPLCVERGRV
jgi:hypothetical protein